MIRSHWLLIAVGLLTLWGMRHLPPDTSAADIRQRGVVKVCHPVNLPPLVTVEAGEVKGLEAEVVRRVADEMGVRVQWNAQRNWYRTFDPTAWGIRKESCDLLVGGVAATRSSESFLVLTEPYLRAGWAWVGQGPPDELEEDVQVGFWAPYLGLDKERFAATDFLDARGIFPYFFHSAEETLTALDEGEVEAVLTDTYTAAWLADETGAQTWDVPELSPFSFALGLWKGEVTLKRAVNGALRKAAKRPENEARESLDREPEQGQERGVGEKARGVPEEEEKAELRPDARVATQNFRERDGSEGEAVRLQEAYAGSLGGAQRAQRVGDVRRGGERSDPNGRRLRQTCEEV